MVEVSSSVTVGNRRVNESARVADSAVSGERRLSDVGEERFVG